MRVGVDGIWAAAKNVERRNALTTINRVRIGVKNVELYWQELESIVEKRNEPESRPQTAQRHQKNSGALSKAIGGCQREPDRVTNFADCRWRYCDGVRTLAKLPLTSGRH